jgi:hypothetical protein
MNIKNYVFSDDLLYDESAEYNLSPIGGSPFSRRFESPEPMECDYNDYAFSINQCISTFKERKDILCR